LKQHRVAQPKRKVWGRIEWRLDRPFVRPGPAGCAADSPSWAPVLGNRRFRKGDQETRPLKATARLTLQNQGGACISGELSHPNQLHGLTIANSEALCQADPGENTWSGCHQRWSPRTGAWGWWNFTLALYQTLNSRQSTGVGLRMGPSGLSPQTDHGPLTASPHPAQAGAARAGYLERARGRFAISVLVMPPPAFGRALGAWPWPVYRRAKTSNAWP